MTVLDTGNESESDTSSILTELFSDDELDDDSATDLDPDSDSEDPDDESDSEDDEAVDEGQLSAEEYLAKAEQLDVSQLRQKRYSPKTQEKLDETGEYWNRHCRLLGVDPSQQWHWISDSDDTVRFLYGFFGWRCDIRRGKNGRRCPGIRYKSSLESFWKWWHLVLKQKTSSGLSKDTMVKVDDVIALVAEEKKLELHRRPKKNMYIEDVAEFARVLLTTTETTFGCGWRRIQLLFYIQLAAITASRPGALLHLRYRDLGLKLIRDPDGGRPHLFIFLKPDFTKRFLGKKPPNEFKIPEIIFDPTLALSPHVTLLSMLFHIQGFKRISKTGPVLDSAAKLYSLDVPNGKGKQDLHLKDELLDKYVFCQVERETTGYRLLLDKRMTASTLGSQMRRVGEITGFEDIVKPYCLRYAGAKAFNNSDEVSEALQNVILQHSDIRTFINHYEVDVDVDTQGVIRETGSQTDLVRFACSLSASIDPNRPFWLSPEESKSLNSLPEVGAWQDAVHRRKRKWKDRAAKFERARIACQARFGALGAGTMSKSRCRVQKKLQEFEEQTQEAKRRYDRAVRELRNEKQRQRNRRIRENLQRYRDEQPVIDVESQLAGMMIDTKVIKTLEHQDAMSAQHLSYIGSMMAAPGKTIELEYQRRIRATDEGVVYCGMEEGRPTRRTIPPRRSPSDDEEDSGPPAKRPRCSADGEPDCALQSAIKSVVVTEPSQRPVICFLCVGNPQLPMSKRTMKYKNPGSLTRHFVRTHAKLVWTKPVRCNVCLIDLKDKMALMRHAESEHGTVCRSHPSVLGL
ncbi:Threonine--tRNA ligase [Talaromyces islandicus]|uniref:Threonine--tRNA ligase n=1 Tax=Talaromyces islandicus TaxID=28573 RepID=A0A0U1LZT8_TALIS|nr:Threonine--tRNA ligase [Talaromyces islandicus]